MKYVNSYLNSKEPSIPAMFCLRSAVCHKQCNCVKYHIEEACICDFYLVACSFMIFHGQDQDTKVIAAAVMHVSVK